MDAFEELENMALNAVYEHPSSSTSEAFASQITRWQRLFHFSHSDAVNHIEQLRIDLTRMRISDEHWEMVRSEREAQGYDRETYEYEIHRGRTSFKPSISQKEVLGAPAARGHSTFLVKLEGPLPTPQKVQEVAGLATVPNVIKGTGDTGETKFCRVDGNVKKSILEWLSREQISSMPTFIRLSKANKNLSHYSIYPTLGLDSSLPQHRPNYDDTAFYPTQDQYPVWYFFYGTLSDPAVLSHVISLPEAETPDLRPARIPRGSIRTWGGKYKALVDAPDSVFTDGWAYNVNSKVGEEALLFYETEKYEVVRCDIFLKGEERGVKGCTFRFVGCALDLT